MPRRDLFSDEVQREIAEHPGKRQSGTSNKGAFEMAQNRHGRWAKYIPDAAFKSQRELADELGMHQQVVAALKSGKRGLSPEAARNVAAKSGEPAPTLYLVSQLASMEHRAATKSISEAGFMGSAQYVVRNISSKFRPEELRAARKDPNFQAAARRLRELLLKALDLVGPDADGMGPAAGSGN